MPHNLDIPLHNGFKAFWIQTRISCVLVWSHGLFCKYPIRFKIIWWVRISWESHITYELLLQNSSCDIKIWPFDHSCGKFLEGQTKWMLLHSLNFTWIIDDTLQLYSGMLFHTMKIFSKTCRLPYFASPWQKLFAAVYN